MSIISFQPNTVSELKAITENKDAKIDQNDISKIGKSSPKLSPQQIKNQKQFFSNYKFSMALNEEEQISKKKKSSQFSVKKKYSADSLKFEQDSQKTVSAKDANIIDKSNIVSE